MKRHGLSLILLACLAIGSRCSEGEKTTLCFLKTFTSVEGFGTSSQTFTYQLSRPATWQQVLITGDTITSFFEYSSIGLVTRLVRQYPGGPGRVDYGYDSLKRLTREDVVAPAPFVSHSINYTYNIHYQVISAVYTIDTDTFQTYTFTYPDTGTKNPSTIQVDLSTGATTINTYTYDDKINPMRGLLPSSQIVNNILTHTVSGGSTTTYTYQYNGAGYAVSATSSSGGTYAWTFDCQEM